MLHGYWLLSLCENVSKNVWTGSGAPPSSHHEQVSHPQPPSLQYEQQHLPALTNVFQDLKMSEEYYHNISLEALDDLACRFLLNIPDTDKSDPIRWELCMTMPVLNNFHSGFVSPSSRLTGSTWSTARRLRLVTLRILSETRQESKG